MGGNVSRYTFVTRVVRGAEVGPYYTYHATPLSAMHSMGTYIGYAYRFEFLGGRLYPSVGAGTRLGYLKTLGSDWGIEVTARVPLAVTYYITEDIGVLLELGFGYGTLLYGGGGSFFTSNGFYTDGGIGIRWP